jgi:poly(A) polymerase
MEIRLEQIDPDALRVVQRLLRYQHKAYLVGGCVRDLLLGRKPKDFDVATSATPNDIRRCFRNCRIIGRRFRLAHVFFGRKIIEDRNLPHQSTPPRTTRPRTRQRRKGRQKNTVGRRPTEQAQRPAHSPRQCLRHRRRGCPPPRFHHQRAVLRRAKRAGHRPRRGLPDLEARLVRTIGDPDIRFREDPVRILRAVKFAARCDLTIEPKPTARMMEHKAELAKCAQARVTEEFYRLLRAGAARAPSSCWWRPACSNSSCPRWRKPGRAAMTIH